MLYNAMSRDERGEIRTNYTMATDGRYTYTFDGISTPEQTDYTDIFEEVSQMNFSWKNSFYR